MLNAKWSTEQNAKTSVLHSNTSWTLVQHRCGQVEVRGKYKYAKNKDKQRPVTRCFGPVSVISRSLPDV